MKRLMSKIDWEAIQMFILVWTLPGMLVLGAVFYELFSSRYR